MAVAVFVDVVGLAAAVVVDAVTHIEGIAAGVRARRRAACARQGALGAEVAVRPIAVVAVPDLVRAVGCRCVAVIVEAIAQLEVTR